MKTNPSTLALLLAAFATLGRSAPLITSDSTAISLLARTAAPDTDAAKPWRRDPKLFLDNADLEAEANAKAKAEAEAVAKKLEGLLKRQSDEADDSDDSDDSDGAQPWRRDLKSDTEATLAADVKGHASTLSMVGDLMATEEKPADPYLEEIASFLKRQSDEDSEADDSDAAEPWRRDFHFDPEADVEESMKELDEHPVIMDSVF